MIENIFQAFRQCPEIPEEDVFWLADFPKKGNRVDESLT